jgi:hypothetical protein
VAFVAIFGFQMGTLQLGAGLGVVKTRLLQRDDTRLTALVFGVTDSAIVAFVAMKAPFGGDAGGDLRVANQALGGGHFPRATWQAEQSSSPGLGTWAALKAPGIFC